MARAKQMTYKLKSGKLQKVGMQKFSGTKEHVKQMLDQNFQGKSPTQNQIKAMQVKANKDVKLANIAQRGANIANITAQIGSTARQITGNSGILNQGVAKVTSSNNGVDQAINGGVSKASDSRDEDEGWVE